MRVLVTGISGFIGSHLAEYLTQALPNLELFGLVRPRACLSALKKVADRVKILEADVRDQASVLKALSEVRPDRIFHLAGQSAVETSFRAPAETFSTNALGTVHLLEALLELQINPVVLIASSAEVYGLAYADELPLKETAAFRPLNAFGVSKAAQDLLGFQYYKAYGLKVIRARIFNTLGPRQPVYYQVSYLAKQIAEIEKKKREPVLKVSNLENKKDYTDIRDLVRALWLISEKSEPGEVLNLGSGQAWSGNEILKLMLGMTRAKLVVESDDKKNTLPEPPILLADISRLARLTGWKPQIGLKQSILDLINYWREQV
ncbi:MAG: GDP-mannose 4,6-dehydratase [Candidatus Saccharicenans sp.]|jgi:GDP-4-dehydro-6-deoxy-D-mannose reductase|nr:GDP-mannose 4,6-dehydratase [Candidatus Saccharicenans sp.]MDH7574911.1 GDP-mannose 4,6-dehydratase [Candidatus Saccharicenans sp.]